MASPKIKEISVAGQKRYRFVVDIGVDPATGKRRQITKTFDGKRVAERELAKILTETSLGTYAGPTKITLGEYLDEWLRSAVRGKAANTESAYRHGIMPAKDRLGAVPLQKLTTKHIEDLVDWMLTSGRKRGGKVGTPLSPRAAQITLGKLKTALDDAVNRRLVAFNVAGPVKCPAQVKTKRTPWSPDEVRAFLASLVADRMHAPMLLSLIGMRPEEVCGLRWAEDVDLEAETLTIANVRTLVWTEDAGGQVVEKGPKTEAGGRTLPLPAPVVAALRALKATQAAERLAAGTSYTPSGYVLVDELGAPFKTDQLRRAAYRQMKLAGVRKVRLYDARHACLTYLSVSGVPAPIVGAWAGHADLSMAQRVYVHPSAADLEQGRDALNALFGGKA
ncbi:MAG: site-specific integrase [Actinomycetota bacterium]|nr:site-specific integrase [Actinomycetota bacterium]